MTKEFQNRERKRPPLVFIAEDLPKNLQVVYNILTKEGYDIAAAGDGKKALEMLRKLRPDLILLDVMMPEMNGFDLCRHLKQMPEVKDIPVIFLTAKAESEDIVEGLELGAVDYITKPFKQKELITRVKNHLALKFAREELKESNAAKDKLFSIISHDVRTPLQNLILSADLLKENFDAFDKERIREYVKKFCSNTYALSDMMENLLHWSRSQQHMLEPKPGQTEVAPLVSGVLDLYKDMAEKKQVALVNKAATDVSVYADEDMMNILLRNLVGNALKFTPKGGEITVETSEQDNNIDIAVSDTGVGIAPEDIPGLFILEGHKSTTGTAGEKGTGLGLILCRELVEKNNGAIGAGGEPGKGSCFTVSLPKDDTVAAAEW